MQTKHRSRLRYLFLSMGIALGVQSASANAIFGTYEYFDAEGKWRTGTAGVPDYHTEGDLQRITVGLAESIYGSYQFGELEGIKGNPFNEVYTVFEVGGRLTAMESENLSLEGRIYGRYTKIEYKSKATGDKVTEENYYALGYRLSPYYQILGVPVFNTLLLVAGPGIDGELNVFYYDADPAYEPGYTDQNAVGFGGTLRPFLRAGLGGFVGSSQIAGIAEVGYQYSYLTNLDTFRMYYGVDFRAGLRINF